MERRNFLKIFIGGTTTLISTCLPKYILAKPPERREEILLQNSTLAGFQFYYGEHLWNKLRKGDALTLIPEPENPYDSQAVKVMYEGKQLGYVPRSENNTIHGMLRRKQKLTAKISALNETGNLWERLEMDIYLSTASSGK